MSLCGVWNGYDHRSISQGTKNGAVGGRFRGECAQSGLPGLQVPLDIQRAGFGEEPEGECESKTQEDVDEHINEDLSMVLRHSIRCGETSAECGEDCSGGGVSDVHTLRTEPAAAL